MYNIGPFEYSFKKNQLKKIFCSQVINIPDNSLVLLTGKSGAGKSTLLQMLKGIIPEYSSGQLDGNILFNESPLSGTHFKKNLKEIIFLFQNPFSQLIYPTVPEEFFFSMENFNYSNEMMNQKKEELKGLFDLETIWNKKTKDLSNGECQRLVLASLLAIDPKVILLDEPTAFLDPVARNDFYNWLKKIKGTRTVVIVDHHLEEIIPLADLILLVDAKGELSLTNLSHELLAPAEKTSENAIDLLPLENFRSLPMKIKLNNVSFRYQSNPFLIQNISLQLDAGNICVIKGSNGQGKSTLFKLIAGLLKPITGSIEYIKEFKAIKQKDIYKDLAFVFQNPESHFFYDTIQEELGDFIKFSESKKLLSQFLKDVDLTRSPFLLSEGEKRRLSILMTILQQKSIILYDEPTFGQDKNSIAMIRDIILFMKSINKIQVIISHDDSFIASIADEVFLLKDAHLEKLV